MKQTTIAAEIDRQKVKRSEYLRESASGAAMRITIDYTISVLESLLVAERRQCVSNFQEGRLYGNSFHTDDDWFDETFTE